MKPRTFLSLVRIPTVFSSMSNAYAGYFIGGGRAFTPALALGLAAAALFIMAGMALNDVADKDVDARERPTRPIPSGDIGLGTAWALSLCMMAAGLVLLAFANPPSALFGIALCLAIFAYNFLLKGSALGPAAMGLCRLLNLLTGVTLAWPRSFHDWPRFETSPLSLGLALFSLWAYIALVTFLARDEVGGNTRARMRLFFMGVAAWFILWSGTAFTWYRSELHLPIAWLILAMFLRAPLRNLATDPTPKHTGQMVGAMLRLVPLVDVMAMFANHVPAGPAMAGVLWILPAYAVGKLFYST
jgi:4-hydroxybenzoate polyprenyltransferase